MRFKKQPPTRKFMQVLAVPVYRQIAALAKARGITLQEFIRAVIVPEWFVYDSTRAAMDALRLELRTYLKMRDRNKRRRDKRRRR